MRVKTSTRRALLTGAVLLVILASAKWGFAFLVRKLAAEGIVGKPGIEFPDQIAQIFLGSASVFAPLLCVALILRVLSVSVDFRLNPRRWPSVLLGFVVVATPGVALLGAAAYLGIWDLASLAPPFGQFASVAWVLLVLLFTFISVASEEVMFRGILGTAFEEALLSRIVAIVLVSALFSLAHSQWDWGSLGARMILGTALGWAAFRLAGIEYGVGAHYAINVVSLLLLPPFGIDDIFVGAAEVQSRQTMAYAAIQVQAATGYFFMIVAGAEVLRRFSRRAAHHLEYSEG